MPETREQQGVEDAQGEMEATAGGMQEQGERVDAGIAEARETLPSAQADENVPTAAGDWEDTDDDAGGEDASGFDDPERDEEEDEDDDE